MPKMIDSVHNYCHRWCERCPFTERCSLVSGPLTELPDILDEVVPLPNVFPAMSGRFGGFLERLDRQLRAEGTSLEEISYGADRESPAPARTHVSTFVKLSMDVAIGGVGQRNRSPEWMPDLYHGADFSDPAVQAGHELYWYLTMVGPKFRRCVKDPIAPFPEDLKTYGKYGRDGVFTARLVHLALVRIICAITVLLEARGHEAYNDLIGPLKNVFKLLAGLRKEHPEAYRFRRPGFDDPGERRFLEAFYGGNPPVDPFVDGTWSRGGRAPKLDV